MTFATKSALSYGFNLVNFCVCNRGEADETTPHGGCQTIKFRSGAVCALDWRARRFGDGY
jgi:hypothetical protein